MVSKPHLRLPPLAGLRCPADWNAHLLTWRSVFNPRDACWAPLIKKHQMRNPADKRGPWTWSEALKSLLGDFDDITGFNTIGTDYYFFNLAVGKRSHSLQVWVKSSFGHIMRMADMMSDHWFFAAYFTYFWHSKHSFNYRCLSNRSYINYLIYI